MNAAELSDKVELFVKECADLFSESGTKAIIIPIPIFIQSQSEDVCNRMLKCVKTEGQTRFNLSIEQVPCSKMRFECNCRATVLDGVWNLVFEEKPCTRCFLIKKLV